MKINLNLHTALWINVRTVLEPGFKWGGSQSLISSVVLRQAPITAKTMAFAGSSTSRVTITAQRTDTSLKNEKPTLKNGFEQQL